MSGQTVSNIYLIFNKNTCDPIWHEKYEEFADFLTFDERLERALIFVPYCFP